MNSLEKARQFLAAKASKLAMTVVPLAALTVVAPVASQAAPVGVIFSQGQCGVTSLDGSCTTVATATGGSELANWIALSGSTGPGSSGSATIYAFGSAGGSLEQGVSLPVSWDFTILNPESLSGTAEWNVYFLLNLGSGGTASFNQSGTAAIGDRVTGTGSITMDYFDNIVSYEFGVGTSSQTYYMLDVPSNSTLDLNPVASTGTPEPSTVTTLLGGAAGLFFLRRRKRTA